MTSVESIEVFKINRELSARADAEAQKARGLMAEAIGRLASSGEQVTVCGRPTWSTFRSREGACAVPAEPLFPQPDAQPIVNREITGFISDPRQTEFSVTRSDVAEVQVGGFIGYIFDMNRVASIETYTPAAA